MADFLSIPIEDIGRLSFEVDEEPELVSSTCLIFAKSEAVGLLRKGWPKERILAAYSAATAHRVVELLERIGMEKDFAVTGGIAKNEGVVKRIEEEIKIKALQREDECRRKELNQGVAICNLKRFALEKAPLETQPAFSSETRTSSSSKPRRSRVLQETSLYS